jgi:hypothetical protein
MPQLIARMVASIRRVLLCRRKTTSMTDEQEPTRAATVSTGTAMQLVEEQEEHLIQQLPRLASIRSIEAELQGRVGDATFLIANEFVWLAMLDHRDMCVIHLASWARGMYEKGGFFRRLQSRPPGELFVPDPGYVEDAIKRVQAQERRKRFTGRFPEAAGRGKLQHQDVEALKDSFVTKLESVVDDRDAVRAHRYEKRGAKANVKMLGVTEVADAFDYAKELLNDLRLFASRSTLGYPSEGLTAGANADSTAADLVDLLLLGSFNQLTIDTGATEHLHRQTGEYWYQHREDFFRCLRELHESKADPKPMINDQSLIEEVKAKMSDARK